MKRSRWENEITEWAGLAVEVVERAEESLARQRKVRASSSGRTMLILVIMRRPTGIVLAELEEETAKMKKLMRPRVRLAMAVERSELWR